MPERLEVQKERQDVLGHGHEYVNLIAMVQAEGGRVEKAMFCGGQKQT